jgi:polysaccharide biosynthesis/export protein
MSMQDLHAKEGRPVARARPALRAALLAAAALALAACTLPRSGPTAGEILSAGAREEAGFLVVPVDPAVAAASRFVEPLRLGPGFVGAPVVSAESFAPGDTVSLTVWENVDVGVLAGVGQRVAVLQEIQVDEAGMIFVPYAGRVRASGRRPEELRQAITEGLAAQTPDPQVEVRRVAGDGAAVSVLGGVGTAGVYPIDQATRRLSAMLARAGGVTVVPDVAQVRMQRGGETGTIWLQDLYDDPALDVALRPGDRIIVEEDRRAFTALGAAGRQARLPFTKRDMSVIEALATAGGLDGRSANPTGVFVFRIEAPEVARRVTGREDIVGPQRVAYVLDFTRAQGLLSAREFVIRDEDTIYVTEAPIAAWSRVIGIAGSAIGFASSVAVLEDRITN